jgi:hypothetical protein
MQLGYIMAYLAKMWALAVNPPLPDSFGVRRKIIDLKHD